MDDDGVPWDRNVLLVAQSGLIAFVGKIVSAAARVLIALVVARAIAVEQYGLYSLALSVASLAAGVALLGFDSSVVRYVALAVAARDESRVWRVLQVVLSVSVVTALLASVALFFLAGRVADEVFHDERLTPLLQLAAFMLPLLTIGDIVANASRAFKQMHYSVIAQGFVLPFLRLALVALLAVVGLSAFSALLAYAVALLVTLGLLVFFLHRQFPLRRPPDLRIADVRPILSFSVPVWISEVLIVLRGNMQALLLGSMQSVASVGIFAIASQIMVIVHLVLASISTSAKPFVVELHERGDTVQLAQLYQAANKWSLVLSLPIFAGLILFPGEILSLFGDGFSGGADALVLLTIAHLASVGTGMCGTMIDMTGHARLKLANSVVWLVVLLTSNLVLIPKWGVAGAAASILVAEVVINSFRVVELYWLFRMLPWNRGFVKPIVAVACAMATSLLLNQVVPSRAGLAQTALHGVVIVVVYAALTLALGISSEERVILSRLRHRAGRLRPRSRTSRVAGT
jgi:O-antigen/teichoic acid export membrane protein